jgi:hypothetical protein
MNRWNKLQIDRQAASDIGFYVSFGTFSKSHNVGSAFARAPSESTRQTTQNFIHMPSWLAVF